MAAAPQKKSKSGVVLIVVGVVLLVSLVFCGIIAAIAVPAFTRSVKKSKTAEAAGMTRRIAEGARVYYEEHCEFPAPVARTSPSVTCDGQKAVPQGDLSGWDVLGSPIGSEPLYFVYSTEQSVDGTYVVKAEADFVCGGPVHTVKMFINGEKQGDTCTATVAPALVENELE